MGGNLIFSMCDVETVEGEDAAYLQYLQSHGTPISIEKGAQLAISVGRDIRSALRSGASQPQAHQAMYGKYPDLSLESIHSAAAAGNLIYCPETLG